jgi:phenylalanine-4-hydroxylase
MKDLDAFISKTLECGAELSSDHPGFKDLVYRERRRVINDISRTFRSGYPIPEVTYNDTELETWRTVYAKLRSLYPSHGCQAVNRCLPLLEQFCGYGPDKIPQLAEVSDYLHDLTGWRLRPVTGLLSSRDFLNALAFRVFHSTQYVRHHSVPFYTPEPDCCHDLIGHVPLFADPEFADFSQEIGLASLGVSEKDIVALSTVYWFTVEFGICKESGALKAYGAGLLSSFGELSYCLGNEPKYLPFDPETASKTEYPITKYQPLYFVCESFEDAKARVRAFARSLERPFSVRYNPLTENVEVLDKKESLVHFGRSIHSDFKLFLDAIEKLPIK